MQSLPVVYTTMPTDGVATAAITVPLIGSDGRSEGSGECLQDDTIIEDSCIIDILRLLPQYNDYFSTTLAAAAWDVVIFSGCDTEARHPHS